MPQSGHQQGSEAMWWWKVALHLDEAQFALANAMANNVEDPSAVLALLDKLREAQTLLLEIFRAKHLLPAAANGVTSAATAPSAAPSEPDLSDRTEDPVAAIRAAAAQESVQSSQVPIVEDPVPTVDSEPDPDPAVADTHIPAVQILVEASDLMSVQVVDEASAPPKAEA